MSINMILGSAQSQTNSIKNLTTSQIGSYQQIQQALSNFMFQTNSLQGAAYDSAKAYCGSVLSPLIDGCILLNKAIEKANEEYINKYTSEVYGESLKQSDLERLIDETKSQIALNENLLNEQFEQDPVDLSEVSNLQEKIDSYRKIQRDLEEKLSKLLAFDTNSVSIFQEVDVLSYSVAQGIALAQRSWSPTLKTFMLPGKNEMGWVGTIKEIWEKNNKESNKTNSIKPSKRMINSQISAEEYDRYVAHYSGLHGKPIIGASVIHNASSEEKRDLLIAVLPWTIPGGGSLKTIMASSSFIAGLESIIKGNKPSEILTNMALGGLGGYGFYKIGSKVRVKFAKDWKVLKSYDADNANKWWMEKKMYTNPPYKPNTEVSEVVLTKNTIFVRVYDKDVSGQYGSWVMREKDIRNLSASQIKDKFALPSTPKYITDVEFPAGTKLRKGVVNPLDGWGSGGGVQFDLMGQRIGDFKNERLLR